MKAAPRFVLAAAAMFISLPALAEQTFPKVYDATYETKNAQGTQNLRLTSDGKGKLRTESQGAGYKVVSIIDYPGKFSYSIIDANKMVMKSPLKISYDGELTPAKAKSKNAKDLGYKDIDGHHCKGWQYNESGMTIDSWVDEKAGIIVKSTTKGANVNNEMTLKTYSAKEAPATLFAIPGDYKVMVNNY
ncbi:MAG: hypothetical protein IPP57_03340 [Candidatus Obscuribacter sp.]|jgi:hypothetical protein|nr:hypothetical protein [Candidatus Obscuribacter sp.]MBK9202475.1 hypothetical protein [Candidatus Obscuribacter sp.]MBK9618739.1 hypothetical protein [Candidatus Obscuribacter sp.]MBK9769856.1 hypothetical protein [Candidatus Obscuribacter sp.]